MKRHGAVLAVMVLLFSGAAWAHKYVPDDGSHTGPDTALYIGDTTLSQVAYHGVTPDSARLWLDFDGKAGQSLYFQLGVPYLPGLEDYRPALALIGPGVGDNLPPFDIPEGLGAQVYLSDFVTPTFFDEPFTGTQSWIMFEQTVTLPKDGRYYLVAYDPEGQPGKLWTAVGTREAWTFKDMLTLYQVQHEVRVFHEVANKPMPPFTFAISMVSRILRVLFFFA